MSSTFCFSLATPFARAAILLGLQPAALLTLRLIITTSLLLATLLFARSANWRMDRRGFTFCIVAGIANGIGMLSYFSSLAYINGSIAAMIYAVSPIVVLVLLAFRGERFTARNSVRLIFGLAGVYLLIGPGGQVNLIGAALAAVSVFTVPIQLVLIQWYLKDYDSRAVTFYMVATMMLISTGYWWATDGAIQDVGWVSWALVIALAIIATYIARLLMVAAVRRVGSGQVGLLAPLETLLTVIWSFVFLGERLSPIQWLGSLLVLISAALAIEKLGHLKWLKPTPVLVEGQSIPKDEA